MRSFLVVICPKFVLFSRFYARDRFCGHTKTSYVTTNSGVITLDLCVTGRRVGDTMSPFVQFGDTIFLLTLSR